MIPAATLIITTLAFAGPPDPAGTQHRIEARVDPRVELLSIIFRLAGNNEYNQPNSQSPYADEVAAHFGPFREHAVVRAAQALRGKYGVSYDAVMSMALHIEDTRSLKERIPFDTPPARLDKRWKLKEARDFLSKARDFVEQTEFNKFAADHRELYTIAGERMTAKLSERDYLDWFDTFFGQRPQTRFFVVVGLLNGGCNYGSSIQFPDGHEEISPVLGAYQFDSDGYPVFSDDIVPTVVHEFCHTYTNAFVDRYADELEPAGKRIFPHCAQQMRQQAYGNWQTMMRESFVRACVVRYTLHADGEAAGRAEARRQHERGFVWTSDFAELLGDYEADRQRYPTFDAFMPRIIAFFNEYAGKYAARTERAPRVISMTPANGATDVDPDLKAIVITFDRPMMDKSWAVVGGGEHFPEIAGDLSFDQDCRVLTIPVKLKPDWSYRFWLNRGKFQSFISRDRIPLKSVAVTFKTRKR